MQQSFQRTDFLQPFHLKGLSISSDKNKYIKNVTLQQHVFISNKFLSIPGNGGGLVGQAGAVKKLLPVKHASNISNITINSHTHLSINTCRFSSDMQKAHKLEMEEGGICLGQPTLENPVQ